MPDAKLIHALATDPGRIRSHNEDAAAAAPGLGAYVICDGMGGAAAGEVASRMAIEHFLEHLAGSAGGSGAGGRRVLGDAGVARDAGGAGRDAGGTGSDGVGLDGSGSDGVGANRLGANGLASKPQSRLHAAVYAANEAVFARSASSEEMSGMGTTLVALLHVPGPAADRRLTPRDPRSRFVTPPTLFLANVGDSRCYRRRGGALQQLSTDHSFVEEQVLAGQITAVQAATSPLRNYITRAIGPQGHVEPDIQSYRPQADDLYLMASDGLTRELTDGVIGEILRRLVPSTGASQGDLQSGCGGLIAAANEHGGGDNITVLLLAFV